MIINSIKSLLSFTKLVLFSRIKFKIGKKGISLDVASNKDKDSNSSNANV